MVLSFSSWWIKDLIRIQVLLCQNFYWSCHDCCTDFLKFLLRFQDKKHGKKYFHLLSCAGLKKKTSKILVTGPFWRASTMAWHLQWIFSAYSDIHGVTSQRKAIKPLKTFRQWALKSPEWIPLMGYWILTCQELGIQRFCKLSFKLISIFIWNILFSVLKGMSKGCFAQLAQHSTAQVMIMQFI